MSPYPASEPVRFDLHKIHNYDEDIRTAKQRANIKSCDITASHGCKRCGDVCPLRFDI